MAELVANCPRCKANQMTFDLFSSIPIKILYNWQQWFEAFCICRACKKSTVFTLCQNDYDLAKQLKDTDLSKINMVINRIMNIEGYISLKDEITEIPPEYLPPNIEAAFREGAACFAIGCANAAGTMFRLCVDLATKPMLPEDDVPGLNKAIRRNLGLRLPWLFDNKYLPEVLRDLSICIKEDGNDGAHEGTLNNQDAADILDFTRVLLDRIFSVNGNVEMVEMVSGLEN